MKASVTMFVTLAALLYPGFDVLVALGLLRSRGLVRGWRRTVWWAFIVIALASWPQFLPLTPLATVIRRPLTQQARAGRIASLGPPHSTLAECASLSRFLEVRD